MIACFAAIDAEVLAALGSATVFESNAYLVLAEIPRDEGMLFSILRTAPALTGALLNDIRAFEGDIMDFAPRRLKSWLDDTVLARLAMHPVRSDLALSHHLWRRIAAIPPERFPTSSADFLALMRYAQDTADLSFGLLKIDHLIEDVDPTSWNETSRRLDAGLLKDRVARFIDYVIDRNAPNFFEAPHEISYEQAFEHYCAIKGRLGRELIARYGIGGLSDRIAIFNQAMASIQGKGHDRDDIIRLETECENLILPEKYHSLSGYQFIFAVIEGDGAPAACPSSPSHEPTTA